jgi:hypothetical protein
MHEKAIEILKQIGSVSSGNYLFFAQTLWPHRKDTRNHQYDEESRYLAGALLAGMHKAGLIKRLYDNNGHVYEPKMEVKND